MEILINIVQFLAGLFFVVKGADWLTDGGAGLARRYGISTLVIGLTIVAFGSSAPEFVVSVVSAIKGNTDMAIGNVVGSNIFNILAIMGVTALVAPVKVTISNVRYDMPFILLSSVVVITMLLDGALDGASEDVITRSEGIIMLCIFSIFMSYTYSIALKDKKATKEEPNPQPAMPLWKALVMIITGLAGLIIGGDQLVDGASGIATFMGLSQSIIALTIVSIGTSAPELAASVVAAKKGDTAMALGNIVGSVVFNVFFVLGTSATIFPLTRGHISLVDLALLLTSSVMLWGFCKWGRRKFTLTRTEGAFMITLQVLYYAYLIYKQ